MFGKSLIITISSLFMAASANAALLTNIHGSVLVNKGDGFKLVDVLIGVEPGDRVLVRDESSADIVYDTGCIVPVGAHQMLVVPRDGNCHSTAMLPGSRNDSTAMLSGSLKDSHVIVETGEPEAGRSEIIVGGLVVAAGVATVAAASDGDKGHSKPVSP